MQKHRITAIGCISCAVLFGGLFALAQNKGDEGEQERKIKEAEVPKAALEALKAVAKGAAFTEFSEEIEHGHKFYEGSWKGPDGNIDALVTDAGDLVEIEETVPADKVPTAVRAEAEKAAGKDGKVMFEKKTCILYEIHFKKDGKGHEMIFTPDGQRYHEGGAKEGEGDKDDDDKDD